MVSTQRKNWSFYKEKCFSFLNWNTFWIFNKKLIISLNIFFVKNMKLKNNNFINYFIKIKIEGEVLIWTRGEQKNWKSE